MIEKIYNALFQTLENAIELYEDADLLYNNGKAKRSYTFYHFSFEEGGRFFLLAKVLSEYLGDKVKPNKVNYGYLKSLGFENHIKKLDESILKLVAFPIFNSILQDDEGQTKIITEFYESLKSKISDFNALKNRSIYLTQIKNEFVKPSDSIQIEDVDYMKDLAKMQLVNAKRILEIIKNEGTFKDLKSKYRK